MKINHTYEDIVTGEQVVYQVDDMTAPNSGYTQSYMNKSGQDLEERAQQQYGNDYLEWAHSEAA